MSIRVLFLVTALATVAFAKSPEDEPDSLGMTLAEKVSGVLSDFDIVKESQVTDASVLGIFRHLGISNGDVQNLFKMKSKSNITDEEIITALKTKIGNYSVSSSLEEIKPEWIQKRFQEFKAQLQQINGLADSLLSLDIEDSDIETEIKELIPTCIPLQHPDRFRLVEALVKVFREFEGAPPSSGLMSDITNWWNRHSGLAKGVTAVGAVGLGALGMRSLTSQKSTPAPVDIPSPVVVPDAPQSPSLLKKVLAFGTGLAATATVGAAVVAKTGHLNKAIDHAKSKLGMGKKEVSIPTVSQESSSSAVTLTGAAIAVALLAVFA